MSYIHETVNCASVSCAGLGIAVGDEAGREVFGRRARVVDAVPLEQLGAPARLTPLEQADVADDGLRLEEPGRPARRA